MALLSLLSVGFDHPDLCRGQLVKPVDCQGAGELAPVPRDKQAEYPAMMVVAE
jgi:hypothetical protein